MEQLNSQNEQKPVAIVVMLPKAERLRLISELGKKAHVLTLATREDVLNYLKSDKLAQSVALFVVDFSDPNIDAWGIFEPMRIVKNDVPLYAIISEADKGFQEMYKDESFAAIFTQPVNIELIMNILDVELADISKRSSEQSDQPIESSQTGENQTTLQTDNTLRTKSQEVLDNEFENFFSIKAELEAEIVSFYQRRSLAGGADWSATEMLSNLNRDLNELLKKHQKSLQSEGIEKNEN